MRHGSFAKLRSFLCGSQPAVSNPSIIAKRGSLDAVRPSNTSMAQGYGVEVGCSATHLPHVMRPNRRPAADASCRVLSFTTCISIQTNQNALRPWLVLIAQEASRGFARDPSTSFIYAPSWRPRQGFEQPERRWFFSAPRVHLT